MGLAMATRFAQEGMKVALADVDSEGLEQAVRALSDQGHDVVGVPTDVADVTAVERLRDATFDKFGGVHILCSHAGAGGGGPISQPPVNLDGWHRGFEITMFGVLNGINA